MEDKDLVPIFRRHPLSFAYLFGSLATGKASPNSDVDIAAYFSPRVSSSRRARLRLSLANDLMEALHRDDLDLVVLNDAPPLLAFRAIQPGRVLFSRDERLRTRFEARAMSLYFDRLRRYTLSAEAMVSRVARQGFR